MPEREELGDLLDPALGLPSDGPRGLEEGVGHTGQGRDHDHGGTRRAAHERDGVLHRLRVGEGRASELVDRQASLRAWHAFLFRKKITKINQLAGAAKWQYNGCQI